MTKKILVVTDAQNEFVTGALGNQECEAAVPHIVEALTGGEYEKVIVTHDTHGADYLETQEGRRLPVLHGQEGTPGYEIHPDIEHALQEHYDEKHVIHVKKPTFGSLDFGNVLKALWEEITSAGDTMEVHFTGFCTGICVLSNVVMAKTFVPEARVCVIEKACACVTPQTHKTAIAAMGPIQVDII